ncbi:MAG TPA: deoxyribodipyrimidine photo-lyase [Flavobacterium sp.]|jgi:deoxyribodipyrimidine photo-lyase
MINIFWFRRDLRLEDNVGLHHALQAGEPVLPVFIFDTDIISELPEDDARITFIHTLLAKIDADLQRKGTSLAVFKGKPVEVFKQLIAENEIKAIYTNRDYEPYAQLRDSAVAAMLKSRGIDFYTFKDHVIFEKDDIVKDNGEPYVVYTPYARKWKAALNKNPITPYADADFSGKSASHSYVFPSLQELGFTATDITARAAEMLPDVISNYKNTRDFPAISGTSSLSPHLRFGAVSIRNLANAALQSAEQTFLSELIWREFFMQILWHFPQTVSKSFRPQYDNIRWRNNETEFAKWCEGNTGYPIVDAGMRELNATGLMHNRVRMITASFLCKHLLIDWRWGEAYFALKLLDYEQASNVGNWQWAAGSGVDAAPYFRIFNPSEQVKKFDKELKYIRKWIAEFNELSYPQPIVDHKEARERCLRVYKEALANR